MTYPDLLAHVSVTEIVAPTILAIDPGTTESAVVQWDGKKIGPIKEITKNEQLEDMLQTIACPEMHLVIEMIQCRGMPVGKETFETILWIGRFEKTWEVGGGNKAQLVYRQDEQLHHCHSCKANDSNIRQVLVDRIGPQRLKQEITTPKGKKKTVCVPGPTAGIHDDLWQALAVAVMAYDWIVKPETRRR